MTEPRKTVKEKDDTYCEMTWGKRMSALYGDSSWGLRQHTHREDPGKIKEAEINVAEMFKKMMGTDKNIVERLIAEGRPSFSGPEERRF